jgi:hypothetical protein
MVKKKRGAERRVFLWTGRSADQPALATAFLATAFFAGALATVFLATGAAAPTATLLAVCERALP